MNLIKKIGLSVALTAPLIVSAQLIDPGVANTSTLPGLSAFHNVIIAMNADVGALADGTSDGTNYDTNPLHLALEDTFYWNGTSFSDTFNGGSTFSVLNSPLSSFTMGDTLDIGYIGNESEDDNEVFIRAYSDDTNAPAITQTLIPRLGKGPALFDYDAGDPNSLDDPPMSYSMFRQAGYTGDIFFDILHDNKSRVAVTATDQENTNRFKIWEEITESGSRTGNYLLAISDRDRSFDNDGDDGFFFLGGEVVPVPEPSQIAALAMAGLGGLLYIRRRVAKNRK